MHGIRQHTKFAAERFNRTLQPEADTEERDLPVCRVADDIRNTEVGRPAGTRGDQNQVGAQLIDHAERETRSIRDDFGSGLAGIV